MIKNKKEKAINLILLGLALKYLPLIAIAIFVENLNNLPYALVFLISGLFLLGYTSFIKGCVLYVQSKGYSSNRGWLGLLSIFCLLIILLMPDKRKMFFPQYFSDNNLKENPFWNINIPELFLLSFVSVGVALVPFLILYLLDGLNFNIQVEENTHVYLTAIFSYILYLFILIIKLQELGLKYTNFIKFKNKIAWKLILFVALLELTFSESLNSLILYKLSFIFPGYVEEYLNETNFTNILEIILWSCFVVVLLPIVEGLFFHGIVLQKWSIKWGVKSGVITTSFVFAISGLNFDIITLFISSILYSILYFKTYNLLTPILCRIFHNAITTVFDIADFFSKSTVEREFLISVGDYQNLIKPLFGQRVLLIALTVPLIAYFIYKNFPKNDATIPYYNSVR